MTYTEQRAEQTILSVSQKSVFTSSIKYMHTLHTLHTLSLNITVCREVQFTQESAYTAYSLYRNKIFIVKFLDTVIMKYNFHFENPHKFI